MAWLESLAQGLRGAGGILDQNVYQEGLRDERLKEVEYSRRRDLIAQQIVKGMESGAIPKEQWAGAQETLGKLGYPNMPVGLTLGAQQQQQAIADKQEHAALLQSAPAIFAKGDPKEVQALMMRLAPQQYVTGMLKDHTPGSTSPDIERLLLARQRRLAAGDTEGAATIDHVIQNKELGGTSQTERAFRTMQKYQMKVNGGQPLSQEEEMDAQLQRSILSQQRMQIDPVTQRPVFSQPITIPQSITVGMGGGGGAPAPGGPRPNELPDPGAPGGRKALDAASEKELQGFGDATRLIKDLDAAFKPAFAGYLSDNVGKAVQEYGRRVGTGSTGDMAKFWELYEQWITDMRKDAYGLTLTGNELEQFNRFRANPSQTPEQVQNNLKRQVAVLEGKAGRRMTGLARAGFNTEQMEGIMGWGITNRPNLVNPGAGQPATRPAPSAPSGEWGIREKR